MKRIAITLFGIVVAALSCFAESPCIFAQVRALINVQPGSLTLADLLETESCPALRKQASLVTLGAVPRAGGERVLEGSLISQLVDGLPDSDLAKSGRKRIPQRIVIRSGSIKSCAEIASLVAHGMNSRTLDCASARDVPEAAPLELVKTVWNASLQRWEFSLRCVKPEDCIPFLVWSRGKESLGGAVTFAELYLHAAPKTETLPARLVKRGQQAILTWDRAGIRVVLSVICLDAGGPGEFVRVQIPNAIGTLRVEVLADGTLRRTL